jgi:PAS domain S-box-containing protein
MSATESANDRAVKDGEVQPAAWADISGFERAERLQRFRVELSDSLREFTDAPTMGNTACRMVAEFLGVARANWALAYPEEQRLEVQEGWREGKPGNAGVYSYTDMGLELLERLSAGETVIVNDASTHPLTRERYAESYAPLGIGAFVAISLIRSANLLAIMSIQNRRPRNWTEDETELLEDAARRVWDAIERSRSDAQVRRVTERYRALAETAATIVFVASPDGLFTEVPLVCGLDDQIAESKSSDAWLAAIHPNDLQEFFARWSDAVENKTPYEFDFRVRMRGGSYRWHSARAVRVLGDAGQTLEWVGSCVDVHDRVLSEQRLKKLNAELDERVRRRTADLQLANEEMEGFTYSVSHDLRAPLRAIVATSKILLMDCEHLSESHREMLQRQAYNGNRLATLMDELLQLSRIGRHEIKRVDIDMSKLAQEVLDEARTAYPATYEFEIARDLRAVGDSRLVRLVLGNLIENAMKFSPNGGPIRFGQRKWNEELAFFISDEGVGFDMAFVDKLFLPFERLVLESEFPGTGIGLANVKRIVQRHGGRVWAESGAGRGATFYFTLGENIEL